MGKGACPHQVLYNMATPCLVRVPMRLEKPGLNPPLPEVKGRNKGKIPRGKGGKRLSQPRSSCRDGGGFL